jgi:carotenoid cleavage dioxygenase
MPSELELDTLDTVGRYDFGEKIQGPVTAHPRFDPVNGDLLFFAWQPAPPYLTWYRADRDGTLVESQNIDTGFSSLVHDFIATDNYAIFFECPSAFKLENAKRGEPLFIWEPETRHTHSRHERQER